LEKKYEILLKEQEINEKNLQMFNQEKLEHQIKANDLQKKINELEYQSEKKEQENAELQQQISNLELINKELKEEKQNLKINLSEVSQEVIKIEKRVKILSQTESFLKN
jgi:chromosome segregation ATPase